MLANPSIFLVNGKSHITAIFLVATVHKPFFLLLYDGANLKLSGPTKILPPFLAASSHSQATGKDILRQSDIDGFDTEVAYTVQK